MKKHLMLKGKPLCGVKKRRNKLQFVEDAAECTCLRCLKAIEK